LEKDNRIKKASAKISHERKRFACNSRFNCLRNWANFDTWNAVSNSRPSGLGQAQIQLDSVQIEFGFAAVLLQPSQKSKIRIRYIMEYNY
jgi:hypothetical protein